VFIEELGQIGQQHGIPVVHDLGSGCLINLEKYGSFEEPGVQRSLAAGADLVCFSGDKLLGGPQSGLILGRRDPVHRCRNHPLYRALRCDRLTYLALEATLRVYLEGEEAVRRKIPAVRRLLAEPADLKKRAQKLTRRLAAVPGLTTEVIPGSSQAGSGSLPTQELPTFVVRLTAPGISAETMATRLRHGNPPLLARVRDDTLMLDVRTISEEEYELIEQGLRLALNHT
jgi:L-seryl-tRNA(Ser) seleniumtransferase